MTLKALRARLRRAIAARRSNARWAKRRRHRIRTLTAKVARRPKLAFWLISRHPALRFASGFRTKQHNDDVGGVPNSWHTKGTVAAPGAIDLVGPLEAMEAAQADARAHVSGLAENLIHDVGSGLHLHLGGQGVIDFDWPAEAELRVLKRRRAANLRRVRALDRVVHVLRARILARTPQPAKGIDVSMNQGIIDWDKVKAAGYDFAWIKSSEGGTWRDIHFFSSVIGARKAGLKVGAYHYVRPQEGRNGAEEAAFFHERLKRAGLGEGDLIPILDVEERGSRDVATYAREALTHLETLTGHKVGLYTFPFFLAAWPRWFRRVPLWIADFGGLSQPRLPKPFTRSIAWQHTSKGSVPGVNGAVDKSVTADLKKLIA